MGSLLSATEGHLPVQCMMSSLKRLGSSDDCGAHFRESTTSMKSGPHALPAIVEG